MILFPVKLIEENVHKKIESKIDKLVELQELKVDQCLKHNSESTQTNDFHNLLSLFPSIAPLTSPPMSFISIIKCK